MIDPHTTTDRALDGTRIIDAAKGIIVAVRGCTLSEAFGEILDVATQHMLGPLAVSQALVDLAEGRPPPDVTPAGEAARQSWAAFLPRPTPTQTG